MKKWVFTLVPIALLTAIMADVIGSHIIPQSVQDNFAREATTGTGVSLNDNIADASLETPTNDQQAAVSPDNMTAPVSENEVFAESPTVAAARIVDDTDADAQLHRKIGMTIRRATVNALESGAPTHWQTDGLSGDVVVSEAEDDGQDETCRTVSATIGSGDDHKQSGDHVWCQPSDGGEWGPQ